MTPLPRVRAGDRAALEAERVVAHAGELRMRRGERAEDVARERVVRSRRPIAREQVGQHVPARPREARRGLGLHEALHAAAEIRERPFFFGEVRDRQHDGGEHAAPSAAASCR